MLNGCALRNVECLNVECWVLNGCLWRCWMIDCWMVARCAMLNVECWMVAFGDVEWLIVEWLIVELLHSSFLILHRLRRPFNIPHSTFHILHRLRRPFNIQHSTFVIALAQSFNIPPSTFVIFFPVQEKKFSCRGSYFCCFVLRLQSYYISRQNAIVVRKSWGICTEVAFKLRLSWLSWLSWRSLRKKKWLSDSL